MKIADRRAYKKYKFQLQEEKWRRKADFFSAHNSNKSLRDLKGLETIGVVHSGNSGDIIYSLPSLLKINELTGRKFNFLLKLNQPHNIGEHYSHPLGQVMLNEKMIAMLTPLLESQEYIEKCEVYYDQVIDIDLDGFRKAGILLDRGDIGRWCGYTIGINPDLYIPWLSVEPDIAFNGSIVISRSERYRNSCIDYSFIAKYEKVFFVGVKAEYDDLKKLLPTIKWIELQDFLKLAQIIAGCKLFIGNQSFPFSIAEGLKVPRVLETYAFSPNVVPQGPNGYDFYFQNHFEDLVSSLYE
ncbi:MAG TPA: hypothetical protein VGB63_09675 [Pedobacter sp.]